MTNISTKVSLKPFCLQLEAFRFNPANSEYCRRLFAGCYSWFARDINVSHTHVPLWNILILFYYDRELSPGNRLQLFSLNASRKHLHHNNIPINIISCFFFLAVVHNPDHTTIYKRRNSDWQFRKEKSSSSNDGETSFSHFACLGFPSLYFTDLASHTPSPPISCQTIKHSINLLTTLRDETFAVSAIL